MLSLREWGVECRDARQQYIYIYEIPASIRTGGRGLSPETRCRPFSYNEVVGTDSEMRGIPTYTVSSRARLRNALSDVQHSMALEGGK